ncbi:MAG: hypothetical protein P4L22_03765 [Candidatus Babeliales bacterium]|nr:hypothetical protein [Candidatus Babeliales bacterium]
MIDTIVLTLTKDMYHVSEPDKFKPSAAWVNNPTAKIRSMVSKQNSTKKELLAGIYKPHLTIAHRINNLGSQVMLKIELSLPKLIFGNNFDELQYKDFKSIITKLVNALKDMGVTVTADTLCKASVSAIHYSKNIPFTDGSIPYSYINKIKEANIQLSLDVNQTDYRNDGHSYKWHCNRYEVVFYDKIRDLEKAKQSSKRALEKDSNLQLNIFNTLTKRNKLEILRMEVRLNKRDKMKQLFKKLKIKSNLTFKSLFKPAISKKILLHYVDELESKRPKLLDYKVKSDKGLLTDLIINNPDLDSKKVLQLFGLKKAIEVVNLRELRTLLGNYSDRTWYRLMQDANKVNLPTSPSPFNAIRACINKFRPLRLNKFI